MADITASMVKELREATGLGMSGSVALGPGRRWGPRALAPP